MSDNKHLREPVDFKQLLDTKQTTEKNLGNNYCMKETPCPDSITASYIVSVKSPTEVVSLSTLQMCLSLPKVHLRSSKHKHFLLAFFLTWISTEDVFNVLV